MDQKVALLCAGLKPWRLAFQICAAPSLVSLPAASVFLLDAVRQRLARARVDRLWLTVSLATLAATAAKDELKWMFGRPWPFTWLDYGAYDFRPFTDSFLYGAFPSGHTAYIAAPLWVLWCRVPRWRLAYAALTGVVMLGLVGADYHFVSDVLAGLLTGVLAAAGTMVLCGE